MYIRNIFASSLVFRGFWACAPAYEKTRHIFRLSYVFGIINNNNDNDNLLMLLLLLLLLFNIEMMCR